MEEWQKEMQNPEFFKTAIGTALLNFLSAETWDKMYEVLKMKQNVLLSETALRSLRGIIAEHRKRGNTQVANILVLCEHILEDARQRSVEQAWESFKEQKDKAYKALDALI